LISYWGRAPVLFWASILGTLFTIGATVANDFNTYYAMRAVMGLFLTAPQTISIAFIKDIFFFHEHARKIGLWAALYISSPYLGPLLANFIVGTTADWQHVYHMCLGVCGIYILLIVAFLDESYYGREISEEQQPSRGTRLMRLVGVWQINNHGTAGFYSLFGALRRLFATITKPALVLILFG
jgi:MFS family permease